MRRIFNAKLGVSYAARLIINIFLVLSSSIIFAMQRSFPDNKALLIPPVDRKVAEPVVVREMARYFFENCLFFAASGDDTCCARIMFLREFDLNEVMLLIDQGGSIIDAFKIALREKGFEKVTVSAKRSIDRLYSKLLLALGSQEVESSDEAGDEPVLPPLLAAVLATRAQRR